MKNIKIAIIIILNIIFIFIPFIIWNIKGSFPSPTIAFLWGISQTIVCMFFINKGTINFKENN